MFFKKLLSIDIGTKNIKLVTGFEKKNMVNIENMIISPLPPNSFEDGEILSIEELKKTIKKALEENKVRAKKCIITLQSTSVITREIVLPSTKQEDLKAMVKMEIEEYLPIAINEHIVEYKILEEFEENDVKKLRILVAVLAKKFVEAYLKLIKDMKMTPVALDIQANSISKLFDSSLYINDEKYSLDETVAVIDLGNSYINVKIIEKGTLCFNRIIPQGGKDIDMAIANSYNLSIDEAEKRKIEAVKLSDDIDGDIILNELVKADIDSWILEIQRIFRYYTSRSGTNRIDKVYLYGGNSNIKDIYLYMSKNLNIPTCKIESISNVKIDKNSQITNLDKHLNSIAAIIRR